MSERIRIPVEMDLSRGKRARLQTGELDLALFNVDDRLYAIDDSCPHQGASLLMGKIDGTLLRCPAHGLQFDLSTGCMRGGGIAVRSYPLELIDGAIYLTVPDATT